MKDFIHSVKFKILVGILALLLGVLIYSATSVGGRSFISSAVGVVVSPFQKMSTAISHKVSKTLDMLVNAEKYYNENQQLKKQLDDIYSDMIDYDNIKEDNRHYKEILELKTQYPDYKFSPPCNISGWVSNDIYKSFYIDKGSRDGIAVNDPVVTGEGLVGIVSEVQLTYAKVTTVLSPKYPLGVISSKTKEAGYIEGSFSFAEEGYVRMKILDKQTEVTQGDIIVTSGHSGLVPRDRIVGTVDKVGLDKSGLVCEAWVKPVVDFSELTNVFVITEFEGQGEGYAD